MMKQDEEQRVWYVGLTRCSKNLFLIRCKDRSKEFKNMNVYKKQIGGSHYKDMPIQPAEFIQKQIGGTHYKDMKIQPSEFINENKLLFAEGNAIKYICRHASKGEVQDLEKAKHYIDMIIERDYS